MAGDWIKFEHTTPDKPEVIQIAAALRIDQDAVVGKLLRVWLWADQNSLNGAGMSVTGQFIDRLVCKRGFAAAMRAAGWLHGDDGALSFHNFDRHNGATAKARAMDNRKKANQRQRDKGGEQIPDNVPTATGQAAGQKPGPEKRREEKSNTIPQTPSVAAQAPDPRHSEITQRWGPTYSAKFGTTYAFQPRDAATLKRFLQTCADSPDVILKTAGEAWDRLRVDRFAKNCKHAGTIHGLCVHYNDIRVELQMPEFRLQDKTASPFR
jgi:hypothetical protein